MKNTLQRIKEFIDYKGISVRSFEQAVGFSNGSFASQLKNNKTIGVDKLENILHIYQEINIEWLLTGKGEMLKEAQSARDENIEDTLMYSVGAAVIYKEFLEKKEKENRELHEEIGALKEKIKQLEENQNSLFHVAEEDVGCADVG